MIAPDKLAEPHALASSLADAQVDDDLRLLVEAAAVDLTLPADWDHAPFVAGQTVSITVGTPMDGTLSADAEVVRIGEGSAAEFVLRLHGPLRRQQRRLDVRLVLDVPARRTLRLSSQGVDARPIRGHVLDLSAGGVLLRTDQEVQAGERLVLAFTLPGDGAEIRVSVVVRYCRRPDAAKRQWESGCQFQVLRPADRERIARFIFVQQRDVARRRRALLEA